MSSCSAASRREAPPSTCAITSMRMSAEYAFGIVRPQTNQCRQTRPFTGPWETCDSIRPEHALGVRQVASSFGQKSEAKSRLRDDCDGGFIVARVALIVPLVTAAAVAAAAPAQAQANLDAG